MKGVGRNESTFLNFGKEKFSFKLNHKVVWAHNNMVKFLII